MGDFSKRQEPDAPAAAKRKQIMVGVLGFLLLVLVGSYFLKRSPEMAKAAVTPSGPAGVGGASRETPAQALAALEADPTENLLQGTSALPPVFSDIPHDPFKMSDRLVKPLAKIPGSKTVIVPEPPTAVKVNAVSPTIPANSLKLESTIRTGKSYSAIINGQIVRRGMIIGDALIVEIQEDHVVVRHKDYADGGTTTVSIQQKVK